MGKIKLTRIGVSPVMSVQNDAADGQRKDPLNEKAAENASTPISEIKCNAQNGERSYKIEKEAF